MKIGFSNKKIKCVIFTDVQEADASSINDLDAEEKCTHDYECIQAGNITVHCLEGNNSNSLYTP